MSGQDFSPNPLSSLDSPFGSEQSRATTKIAEFVQREIELRKTMTFGEWLRHIRHSHDELLRMLTGEGCEGAVRVLLVQQECESSPGRVRAYELPAACRRVVVDPTASPEVIGFFRSMDLGGEIEVRGRIVGDDGLILVGK